MVAHQAPPSLVFSRQEHCSALPFPGWKHQSSVFFGRTDAKAEIPILWPPHAKSWLIGKDTDAGKDWGQEDKGTTKDEMVWVDSGSWWWTGRPGVLQFMGSQRVRHDWATQLNWIWPAKHTHSLHCFLTAFVVISSNLGCSVFKIWSYLQETVGLANSTSLQKLQISASCYYYYCHNY